jgi:hypothetical protein
MGIETTAPYRMFWTARNSSSFGQPIMFYDTLFNLFPGDTDGRCAGWYSEARLSNFGAGNSATSGRAVSRITGTLVTVGLSNWYGAGADLGGGNASQATVDDSGTGIRLYPLVAQRVNSLAAPNGHKGQSSLFTLAYRRVSDLPSGIPSAQPLDVGSLRFASWGGVATQWSTDAIAGNNQNPALVPIDASFVDWFGVPDGNGSGGQFPSGGGTCAALQPVNDDCSVFSPVSSGDACEVDE